MCSDYSYTKDVSVNARNDSVETVLFETVREWRWKYKDTFA